MLSKFLSIFRHEFRNKHSERNEPAAGTATAETFTPVLKRFFLLAAPLAFLLLAAGVLGLGFGSSGESFQELFRLIAGNGDRHSTAATIIWQIRFPRVILAAAVGGTLALGGLVFQAVLRNPLAEPYILGVSGGSAVGAITGMLAGLSPFPGVALASFAGSISTLAFILILAGGRSSMHKDRLLLGGVMMNAFCGAIIMLLISLTNSSQIRHILFWLMGDLSMFGHERFPLLLVIIPCFIIIYFLARPMNVLLFGEENATAMGINVRGLNIVLLGVTSLMVSVVVSLSGLIGFVGLVIPHIFRIISGPDHRLLIPASILGGGTFLILSDLLARTLPPEGEMPVGIITAVIGAPLFIYLLWRNR